MLYCSTIGFRQKEITFVNSIDEWYKCKKTAVYTQVNGE